MVRKDISDKLDHTAGSRRNPETLRMIDTQKTAFGSAHFVAGVER